MIGSMSGLTSWSCCEMLCFMSLALWAPSCTSWRVCHQKSHEFCRLYSFIMNSWSYMAHMISLLSSQIWTIMNLLAKVFFQLKAPFWHSFGRPTDVGQSRVPLLVLIARHAAPENCHNQRINNQVLNSNFFVCLYGCETVSNSLPICIA